ncbi:Uncharacterised protein [Clostridium perfringens]|uniref:Uncharacterized protein n=1 Tax=Clostridium perfringens TaxID=1502 RepID=A0A2X2YE18_CLOPF|nr:Uncharacterised protein [Clostridium perfringens]
MVSATSSKLFPRTSSKAFFTTPGPLTPTFITFSASPTPWKAPAIKGLSSTALQKTTSFAHPNPSGVIKEVSFIVSPISFTASIFIPYLVEPILTEEHTISVLARDSGKDFISFKSLFVKPLCTRAENPPIKSTPTSFAALSIALAISK